MKKFLLGILLVSGLVMVGCQNKDENKDNKTSGSTVVSTAKETTNKTEETTTVIGKNSAEPSVAKTPKQLEEKRKDEAKPDYEGKIDKETYDQLYQLNQYLTSFKVYVSAGDMDSLIAEAGVWNDQFLKDPKLKDIYAQLVTLTNETNELYLNKQLTPEKQKEALDKVDKMIEQVRDMSNGSM